MITRYFTIAIVEKHHIEVIELGETPHEDTGYGGGKSKEDIQSIIDFLATEYYPNFLDKITHLVFSLNKNHIFANGNKRTSIAIGAFFLKINGYNYCVKKIMEDMENVSVSVADNLIGKELLEEIIKSIIMENDYNEGLKLEIIKAIKYKSEQDKKFKI